MIQPHPWPDPGNFWFRRYLEAELPELAGTELSPFQKVSRLRSWVCRNTPRAPMNQGLHLSEDPSFDFYRRDASDIYKAFGDLAGGVMCHGIAYALLKVYELFNFSSFIYDMGFEDSHITHSVVVVTVEGLDGPVAAIQDPYYNLTVLREDGFPVDFFDMLTLLAKHRHDALTISFDKNGEHDYIGPSDMTPEQRTLSGDLGKGIKNLDERRNVFRRFIPLSQWVTRQKVEATLGTEGFPENPLYLFCLPRSVFVDGGVETERAKTVMTWINGALGRGAS